MRMVKAVAVVGIAVFLCSCRPLYYGYLPGTDYKILKPLGKVDLQGKSFDIRFVDNRGENRQIVCSEYPLDRETELEGDLGMRYFSHAVKAMVEGANGKIDPASHTKILVGLDGISFKLIGFGYVIAHGMVQFKVASADVTRTYCSDMTDHDEDSPLKWNSVVTRKTGSRLMVSGATRRAAEKFLQDLAAMSSEKRPALTVDASPQGSVKK